MISLRQNFISSVLWNIYLFLLGSLVLLFFSIYLIIFIPTLVFRPIAKRARPYFRPDLGDIVSCAGSAFAQADDEDYAKSVILTQVTFKGKVRYEALLSKIERHLLNCKGEDGSLQYPEFRQFITNWCGYKFWKWEAHFNLREHVHLIRDDGSGLRAENEAYELSRRLLCRSFEKGKSPWEVCIVEGVLVDGVPSSLLIIRIHHALADGYSILSIFSKLCEDPDPERRSGALPPKYAQITPSYVLLLPFRLLQFMGQLAHNTATPCMWKIPEAEKSPEWSLSVGRPIPVESVQRIKRHFGVSFSAVVFSLLSGGLHRFLVKSGKWEFPGEIPCAIAVPVKDHPDKMINQLYEAFVHISTYSIFAYPPAHLQCHLIQSEQRIPWKG